MGILIRDHGIAQQRPLDIYPQKDQQNSSLLPIRALSEYNQGVLALTRIVAE